MSLVNAFGALGLDSTLQAIRDRLPTAKTPTTTSIPASITSTQILAANANRKGVMIMNDGTAILRLSFTSPATSTNSFVAIPASSFLMLDPHLIGTGAIYGIWAAANGTAQVTEWV